MSLPWWGWVAGGVILVLLGFVRLARSYENRIRGELVAHLTVARPDVRVVRAQRRQIEIETDQGEHLGTLQLDRILREVSRLPVGDDGTGKRALFDQLVAAIGEAQAAVTVDPERDRPRLRPRLVTERALRDLRAGVGTDLPGFPTGVDGLSAVVVLDGETSVAYVGAATLRELGLEPEAALTLAIDNLASDFGAEVVRRALDEDAVNVVKSFDSYDAARLLVLPRLLGEGEVLAAMIPDRDTLVVCRPPADGDWAKARRLARNAAGDPLWREPLRVTRDGIAAAT